MKTFIISLKIITIMTFITGIVYPLTITLLGQIIFPYQSNGSILYKDNLKIGSELISQSFESDKYFWSRPSCNNYNSSSSGASNMSFTNKQLKEKVNELRKNFIEKNFLDNNQEIPNEMIFCSGSGLDPHISIESVKLQIKRVCKSRSFDNYKKERLENIINKITEKPQLFILGNKKINVLKLNIELDKI